MSDKNGKEISFEEFNERFESVEEALKYIAASQAKSEWLRKKSEQESQALYERIDTRLDRITKQLDHITQLTGIAFKEIEFQDEKLDVAGKALSRKRKK